MDTDTTGWWSRHGWTVALLLTAFGIAFALRTIFSGPVLQEFGNLYTYAGGSDSYYHSRVMQYIILNHQNLILDPLLKYPIGAINPREPLFDWMNASLGLVFAPLFGGSAVNAGAFFLNLQAPLWAALGVFPIYLIGREVGDKRTGIIAALLYPFFPASINESIFGYANYLSFYTFIILVVLYSYIRMVRAAGTRRWVESYRSPRSVVAGLRGFARTERTAIKWAVFTGVGFGALALSWQGYTYAIAIVGIFIVLALLIERIRRVDSFGLYVTTWIVGLVGFPIAMPYYLVQREFAGWFDLPLVVFFGILLLLLPFVWMRDLPWVVSIPALVGIFAAGVAVLGLVSSSFLTNIITGQGYFIKTLIYSTVAEAQSPTVDTLIISYGIVTFFLAFVGVGLTAWGLVRGRFKRWVLFFLVFALVSMYLPFSASKFLLIGAPAFALLPAEAIRRMWDLGGHSQLRQGMHSLTDARGRLSALRKSFKARHILVILLVIGLLVPNVWYAIDAGIPSNTKPGYSTQVYDSLPPALQPPASQASSFFFGAAGASLDTPNQYDSAAYNWLAEQDTNIPAPERPAFVSWWDYGFQAIDQGQHPSVADNFQNGIDPAGQFLLAQNESLAISVLSTTLLAAELVTTGSSHLPAGLNRLMAQDGLDVGLLRSYLINESADWALVVSNPQTYLPVNPHTLTDDNAMYLATSYYIAGSLGLAGAAQVYNDIQQFTGKTIRYAMSDSRLFPFDGQQTGIFYAPADLTGRVLDSAGNPATFFNVTVCDVTNTICYTEGHAPPSFQPANYYIDYFSPFYDSMIYHIYIGYNGTDIGLSGGIPGLSGAAVNSPIEPGWMMEHFMVQYQTAYYCPQAGATPGSSCFYATNLPTAKALANQSGGTADTSANSYFGGGESMLVYYAGQTMTGTVTLPDGVPVPGARVTVFDSWGIPHETTLTSSTGAYSVVLPPGEDTVNVTIGTFQALSQQGNILLSSTHVDVSNAVGFGFNSPPLSRTITVQPATVDGFVYWNVANTTSYDPTQDVPILGALADLSGVPGQGAVDVNTDASGTFTMTDVPPGVYNYSIVYRGTDYPVGPLYAQPGAPANATAALRPTILHGSVYLPGGALAVGATVTLASQRILTPTATTTVNSTGEYAFSTLVPGNYTLAASGPIPGYRSLGEQLLFPGGGIKVSVNLTVAPSALVSFQVTAGGAAAPSFPVRLTPLPSVTNHSLVAAYAFALENSEVVYSDASGQVSVTLPLGNYSVYASGYVGEQFVAALATLRITNGSSSLGPAGLALSAASWLQGTVAETTGSGNATSVVIASTADGALVPTLTSRGSFRVALPAGNYSLLTLEEDPTQSAALFASLTAASLPVAAPLSLTPVPALVPTFEVGAPLTGGSLYPAASAQVTVSIGPQGPALLEIADPAGNVTFALPSTLVRNGTYCLGASAPGFVAARQCGLTPDSIAALAQFPVELAPASVTFLASGVPSGLAVTLNLTPLSATGTTGLSLSGGPSFQFRANPGTYSVSARASTASGSPVYLSNANTTVTIPLGAQALQLSVLLTPRVLTKGSLALPAGVAARNVTIDLSSQLVNVSVNGSAYESGFYAAAGTYALYATGISGSTLYVNTSSLSISPRGTIGGKLYLASEGIRLSGTILSPSGSILGATTPVLLSGPGGALVNVAAVLGNFYATLPNGTVYTVSFNVTMSVAGPNGSLQQRFTPVPGSTCVANGSECEVPSIATTLPVSLTGSLTAAGYPGTVPGQLLLIGPYPSANRTVLLAQAGTFSASLLPGDYSAYATASGGAALAEITTITVLPSMGAFSVSLLPTWQETVMLSSPGQGALSGTASVTVRDSGGTSLTFPGVLPDGSLAISLPAGTYLLSAAATGSPYGISINASGSASVTLTQGNLVTPLPLAYQFSAAATGQIFGPARVTVPATGGPVTFGVGLSNTGDVPITVHLVGSPSYWGFSTTLSGITLGVGGSGANASGEVTVTVPAGTLVAHPGIVVEIVLANGTVVGDLTPVPIVTVEPNYDFALQSSGAIAPEIGPFSTLIAFSISNPGNIGVGVTLTVVDAARLQSLGWNSSFRSVSLPSPIVGPQVIAPGASSLFYLNLSASTPAVTPPGSAMIAGTLANVTGALQRTLVIPVPNTTISPGAHFGVGGPGVATPPSAPPGWLIPLLAFLPAIALLGIVIAFSWNRSRRWRR